jgi:hypothetical protein
MDRRQFDELVKEIGFRPAEGAAWGERQGRLVSLRLANDRVLDVITAVDGRDEPTRLQLDSWLAAAKADGRLAEYKDAGGSVTASLNVGGASPADAAGFLDALAAKLHELGMRPGCFECNTAVSSPPALVNGAVFPLCGSCFDRLQGQASAEAERRRVTPSSVARGILGALLGALAGSVAWIAIGALGFYASIAGLAIAWMAAKGYAVLKGGVFRATPFIVAGAVLAAIVFAEGSGVVIQIVKAARSQGYDIGVDGAIRLLPAVLSDGETLVGMLPNFGLGLVFGALGSWRTLRNLHRAAATPVPVVSRV